MWVTESKSPSLLSVLKGCEMESGSGELSHGYPGSLTCLSSPPSELQGVHCLRTLIQWGRQGQKLGEAKLSSNFHKAVLHPRALLPTRYVPESFFCSFWILTLSKVSNFGLLPALLFLFLCKECSKTHIWIFTKYLFYYTHLSSFCLSNTCSGCKGFIWILKQSCSLLIRTSYNWKWDMCELKWRKVSWGALSPVSVD